ncbi:MAG: DUF2103 domain-containing protein [Halobacteriales archaeon]|nr:DUF2103 domain-containing protein [Halobacteriales archaeon]
MECRRCASPLERPGDYCLVCNTPNADAVLVELDAERAKVVAAHEGNVVSERVIKTEAHDVDPEREVSLRNLVGRAVDEIRRKRPEEVYVRGDREAVARLRGELSLPMSRVADEASHEEVFADETEALDVVETNPSDKIGGSHSTLIGGRDGMSAITTVAEHGHVKKIIPGPIDASGRGSRDGFAAKVTRSDTNGNLRLLLRDGSSVQENRIVTTANDRETGERVREELNEALADAGFA